jgi:hypothetical protein
MVRFKVRVMLEHLPPCFVYTRRVPIQDPKDNAEAEAKAKVKGKDNNDNRNKKTTTKRKDGRLHD